MGVKIKSVTIKDFKRFTDLTVQGIPETARLIMLAGPNGSGKSSFFDALHTWHRWTSQKNPSWEADYHVKTGRPDHGGWNTSLSTVEVYDLGSHPTKKSLYVRSAYRNDPEFRITRLQRQGDLLDLIPFGRMIDNDAAVGRNYQRLASQGLVDLYGGGPTTFDEYLEQSIGAVRDPLLRLFPDLVLNSLGNPLENGTFHFSKGTSTGFAFMNLSGGEKAAFDLILDLAIARCSYDDTLFCIDEPESHMNARLQAELLSVLYELVPENCQLMLATHSIGMMRRARDIEVQHPGKVVFLDFGTRNFDEPQVIEPTAPDRAFWSRAYEVALDDLSELVAPGRIVICEGEPKSKSSGQNYSHDARCYEEIFRDEFPETQFVPGGNALEVADDRRGIGYAIGLLIKGAEVVRLIDRDDQSDQQVAEAKAGGVKVLSRRNLESYLFDGEVLGSLATSVGKADKVGELLAEKKSIQVSRSDIPPDDLKPSSGQIYNACKQTLSLTQVGNDAKTFMRDTLAHLIKPGMKVYAELKGDIFGLDTT